MSAPPETPEVTLFTRPSCHLCDLVQDVINTVAAQIPLTLRIVDIDAPGQEAWHRRYDQHVPVIHVGGREIARHRLDAEALRVALQDRHTGA
jgi:glutaredoxin